MRRKRTIVTKELSFSLWNELETLLPEAVGGAARRRLQEGLAAGEVLGLLLYVGGAAVGYCTFGSALAGLPSSPVVGAGAEAIPGFFVRDGFEKEGRQLLTGSLELIARAGISASASIRLPREEPFAALTCTGTGPSFPRPPRGGSLRLVTS